MSPNVGFIGVLSAAIRDLLGIESGFKSVWVQMLAWFDRTATAVLAC